MAKTRIQPFNQEFLPEPSEGTSPFKKIGDTYVLDRNFQTADYIKNKEGIKVSPDKNQRQLPLMMKVIDYTGNGDYKTIDDALNAGETKIFLRAGTYTLTKIHTLAANTVIQGENWKDCIITGDYQFNLGTNDDIVLRDFTKQWADTTNYTIDGTGDNIRLEHLNLNFIGVAGSGNAIRLRGQKSRVKDCFIACDAQAIYCDNNINWFHNNYISGTNVRVDLLADELYFFDNVIVKTSSGGTYTIYSNNGNQQYICNNVFFNNTVSGSVGTRITGDHCVISGNYYEGFSNCIQLYGDGTRCIGNVVKDCTGDGIFVNGSTTPGDYNYIIDNHIDNPGGDGIHLGYFEQLIVKGNAVHSATNHGFEMFDTFCTNNVLIGNMATDCGGDGFHFGLTGTNEVRRSVINSNVAENNTGDGIEINHDYCTIVGNMCSNNGGTNLNETNGGNSQVASNMTA